MRLCQVPSETSRRGPETTQAQNRLHVSPRQAVVGIFLDRVSQVLFLPGAPIVMSRDIVHTCLGTSLHPEAFFIA